MGQLSIAEDLINHGFSAPLLSQQTDANLIPAVVVAENANIPVLNVNDAVICPPSIKERLINVFGCAEVAA